MTFFARDVLVACFLSFRFSLLLFLVFFRCGNGGRGWYREKLGKRLVLGRGSRGFIGYVLGAVSYHLPRLSRFSF